MMQSLPLDGLIIVTLPQDLAAMVVRKAIRMARKLEAPVLGLVKNMSFALCGAAVRVFGPSHARETAAMAVPLLGTMPLDPAISELCDHGEIERYEVDCFGNVPSLLDGQSHHEGGDGP